MRRGPMADNIVHAFGAVSQTELQKEMLERLDEVRQSIEAGNILGFAFAALVNDGSALTGWKYGSGNRLGLIGAIQWLNRRLNDED